MVLHRMNKVLSGHTDLYEECKNVLPIRRLQLKAVTFDVLQCIAVC